LQAAILIIRHKQEPGISFISLLLTPSQHSQAFTANRGFKTASDEKGT